MAHDVFISYSSKDKSTAVAVCAALEADGIRCWIAPRDIRAGADWNDAIIDGLSASHAVVLIWSSHSNESPDVILEVKHAFRQHIAVIPFRIEDVTPSKSLEYYLAFVQSLDALTPPLETHLQSLTEHIRAVLQQSKQSINPKEKDTFRLAKDQTLGPSAQNTGAKVERRRIRPLIITTSLLIIMTSIAIWWRYHEQVNTTQGASASDRSVDKLPFKVDYPVIDGEWVYTGWDQKRLFEKPVIQRIKLEEELRSFMKAFEKDDNVRSARSAQWHSIHLSENINIPTEVKFEGLINNKLTCRNCHVSSLGNSDSQTPRTTCAKCHIMN